MIDFWSWVRLVVEAQRSEQVPSSIISAYDRAFQDEIEKLVKQTHDPAQRRRFREMLACHLMDANGHCRTFANYILGALIRNRVYERADMQAALAYVVEKMMMPVNDQGGTRTTLFGSFDPNQPDAAAHLQARFKTWVKFAVDNVRRGKVPRLSITEPRPSGTVSLMAGRKLKDDPSLGVSSDSIVSRRDPDADLGEMTADIEVLLKRKEAAYGFPLVALFRAILGGMNKLEQLRRFGDRKTRTARKVVVDTIREYGDKTGNFALLNALKRFEGFQANKPMPPQRTLAKTSRPQLEGKAKDYASIVSVFDRYAGKTLGSSTLGTARRRWLSYPPRDPNAGHPNRLAEVLANAVQDGVLVAQRTQKGALVYSLGSNAEKYRQAALA